MKKLLKITILTAIAALHTMCQKDTLQGGDTTSDSVDLGRIHVELSPTSRVAFDEEQVTWSNNDILYFAEISDDKFVATNSYITYKIDPETISEGGQKAEFVAISSQQQLLDGAEYMAFSGSQTYSGSSNYINVFGFAEYQNQSATTDQIDDKWVMCSERFTHDSTSETMSLRFSHITSIISLTLRLNSSSTQEACVNQVMLRSPVNSFSNDLKITTDRLVSAYGTCDDYYIMQIYDEGKTYASISATKGYTVNFQVWWDPTIDEVDGDFTIYIKCEDGTIAQVQTPARALTSGKLYTKELQLPNPSVDRGALDDLATLATIYEDAGGSDWRNSTNWLSSKSIDEWYGIDCDPITGRVIALELNYNNLTAIPAAIGDLESLKYLDLSQNSITAEIPEEIYQLSQLRELKLYSNSFYGDIPAQIGDLSKLEILYLHKNGFYSLPTTIGDLKYLKELNLYNNLLYELPSTIGDIQRLELLNVSLNQLSDNIPEAICDLENLESIDLSLNKLSGSIPSAMGNMPNLAYINLSYNSLSGTIPVSFANLADDAYVSLTNNYISSIVDSSVAAHPNFDAWDL
ncbi:MAG: hypothetical protein SNH63_06915 [Rikenellaceae bacterium]